MSYYGAHLLTITSKMEIYQVRIVAHVGPVMSTNSKIQFKPNLLWRETVKSIYCISEK